MADVAPERKRNEPFPQRVNRLRKTRRSVCSP